MDLVLESPGNFSGRSWNYTQLDSKLLELKHFWTSFCSQQYYNVNSCDKFCDNLFAISQWQWSTCTWIWMQLSYDVYTSVCLYIYMLLVYERVLGKCFWGTGKCWKFLAEQKSGNPGFPKCWPWISHCSLKTRPPTSWTHWPFLVLWPWP